MDRKSTRYLFLLRAHVQLLLQPPHVLRVALLTQWSLKRLRGLSLQLFNFCAKKENRALKKRRRAGVRPSAAPQLEGEVDRRREKH